MNLKNEKFKKNLALCLVVGGMVCFGSLRTSFTHAMNYSSLSGVVEMNETKKEITKEFINKAHELEKKCEPILKDADVFNSYGKYVNDFILKNLRDINSKYGVFFAESQFEEPSNLYEDINFNLLNIWNNEKFGKINNEKYGNINKIKEEFYNNLKEIFSILHKIVTPVFNYVKECDEFLKSFDPKEIEKNKSYIVDSNYLEEMEKLRKIYTEKFTKLVDKLLKAYFAKESCPLKNLNESMKDLWPKIIEIANSKNERHPAVELKDGFDEMFEIRRKSGNFAKGCFFREVENDCMTCFLSLSRN